MNKREFEDELENEQLLPIDPRFAIQTSYGTIRYLIDAVVELVTNSDDSYKRLEQEGKEVEGKIIIQTRRLKYSKCEKLEAIDFAEGMDKEQLKKALKFAGEASGFERGGFFIKAPPPDLIIKTYLKKGQKITTALAGTGFFVKLSKAGYVLLTACDDNEYSYEHPDLKNGVFTYYLDEGFNSPYEVDFNSNQEISAEESYHYSNPRVIDFIEDQHPQMYDGYPGELTLKTY